MTNNATSRMLAVTGVMLSCSLAVSGEICSKITGQPTLSELQRCASAGDAQAQLLLAHRYREGKDAALSLYEAAQWYRAAAEQGEAEAQYQLGLMCIDGAGITEDATEGFDWIARATLQGHPGATRVFNYLLKNPQPMEC
jgi:TPR repeat protein